MVLYFAYGSNMNEKRISERMKEEPCKIVAKGVLKDFTLKFNKTAFGKPGVGWANVIPEDDSSVEGIVFETTEKGLEKLDKFQGLVSGHYYRKEVPIETEKGTVECWLYKAVPDRTKPGLKPPKEYLNHLLAGKKHLSKEYYNKLLEIETID